MQNEQSKQNKHYEAVKRCKERKQIKKINIDVNPTELKIIEDLQAATGLGRKAAILAGCKALLEANRSK